MLLQCWLVGREVYFRLSLLPPPKLREKKDKSDHFRYPPAEMTASHLRAAAKVAR